MADALHIRPFNANYGLVWNQTVTNHVVDASNEGWAVAFQPHTADPITHLGFRYGARAGTPPTYSIRLEGLDASTGQPDNADVGGGSATAVTFTPPADTSIDGLWQWKTLTNAYTPTRGQVLAATIRYSSGTIDGSNRSSFTYSWPMITGSMGFPYALINSGGTWTKSSYPPIFGYRTANGRYGIIAQSFYATATANTAGHKSGMYFTLPSTWGSTFKVVGLEFSGRFGTAGGSAKIGLWTTDGTNRQTATFDSDVMGNNGVNQDSTYRCFFSDTSLYECSYGTKYYIGVEVVSGTVNVWGLTFAEAADRSSWPDGTNRGLVTYNGTTWTETDTTLPAVNIIIEDTTVPAGGGAAGRRNMRGGFIN